MVTIGPLVMASAFTEVGVEQDPGGAGVIQQSKQMVAVENAAATDSGRSREHRKFTALPSIWTGSNGSFQHSPQLPT
jgi:hypothetical protein